MDWDREGRDWPHREHSRFVQVGAVRWHVQQFGSGPAVLLLHGTGASTHTWRALAPLLEASCTLVMPDLPGHGFTRSYERSVLSLPGMARATHALLKTLDVSPSIAIGHSAGAAVIARMCLDHAIHPAHFLSLNGALLPLHGVPAHLFSPLAKLFAATPFIPRVVSWRAADRTMVERLVNSTGSHIDSRGVDFYQRLLRSPDHVEGVLNMMAHWDLEPLQRDLSKLTTPLTLIVGSNDRTVPPELAKRVQALLPQAQLVTLQKLGHLAHEEAPREVANLVLRCAASLKSNVTL